MPDFPVFDVGNVLRNVETIQTSRDARTQANAIAQRNAQGSVLLQNALSEQGGLGSPAINALTAFDPDTGQTVQNFLESRQAREQQEQQDEADSGLALLEAIVSAKKKGVRPSVFLDVINSDVIESLESEGFDLSKTTSEQDDGFIQALAQELVKTASPKGQETARRILGIKKQKFESPSGKEAADRRLILAGGDQEELRRFDEDAARNKALVSINTQTTAAEEAAKGVGKIQAESFGKQLAARDEAQSQNLVLFRASELIERIETQGPGAATLQGVKAFAKGFLGLDLADLGLAEDVAPAEALATISAQMALRLRNPASGLGLTGNTSDKDLAFLKSIPPSIGKTKGGNKLVIKWMVLVNNRKIRNGDVAEQFQRQFGVGGTDDEGRSLNQAIAADNEANPIFGDEDTKILELVKRLGL